MGNVFYYVVGFNSSGAFFANYNRHSTSKRSNVYRTEFQHYIPTLKGSHVYLVAADFSENNRFGGISITVYYSKPFISSCAAPSFVIGMVNILMFIFKKKDRYTDFPYSIYIINSSHNSHSSSPYCSRIIAMLSLAV